MGLSGCVAGSVVTYDGAPNGGGPVVDDDPANPGPIIDVAGAPTPQQSQAYFQTFVFTPLFGTCGGCHGPNGANTQWMKADATSAYQYLTTYDGIVAGDPGASKVYLRTDGSHQNRQLAAADRQYLSQFITYLQAGPAPEPEPAPEPVAPPPVQDARTYYAQYIHQPLVQGCGGCHGPGGGNTNWLQNGTPDAAYDYLKTYEKLYPGDYNQSTLYARTDGTHKNGAFLIDDNRQYLKVWINALPPIQVVEENVDPQAYFAQYVYQPLANACGGCHVDGGQQAGRAFIGANAQDTYARLQNNQYILPRNAGGSPVYVNSAPGAHKGGLNAQDWDYLEEWIYLLP